MELWSALQVCRGMELGSSGGVLQAGRRGGMELGSRAAGVQAWRDGSSGALESYCRRADVEA